MKKTLTIAGAVLISASAFAQTVSSANIVGYSKKDMTIGGTIIATPQFPAADTNGVTLADAFSGLESGDKAYAWNGLNYTIYTYYGSYGWYDGSNVSSDDVLITQGTAVWLQAVASTNVIMSGDVPSASSVTNTLAAGLNLIGNAYPVALKLDDISGSGIASGDKVYAWDGSSYAIYTYYGSYGWYDGSNNPSGTVEIGVGDGFWLKSALGGEMVMDKAY